MQYRLILLTLSNCNHLYKSMPKPLEGISQPEHREAEKPPRVLVVYRDNSMFRELVPRMVDTLTNLGREVQCQVFPEGTSETEIKKWFEDNRQTREGDLISDGTYERSTGYEERPLINLDDIAETAAFASVCEESIQESRETDVKDFGKGITRVVQNILANPQNAPKKVFILTDRIFDHYPLEALLEDVPEIPVDQIDEIFDLYYWHEQQRKEFNTAAGRKRAAATVKKWLIQGGVPEEIISIEEQVDETKGVEINQKGNWVVVDRHNSNISDFVYAIDEGSGEISKIHPSEVVELRLPLINFFSDAKEAGLIQADPSAILNEAEKILRKKFQKPTQSLSPQTQS